MPIELPKGLPFSVDTWSLSSRRKKHHFLTHAHKDHSIGISNHFYNPIYCTLLTKSFILQQLPQLNSSLFIRIEVGERLVLDNENGDGTFSVTAFDANHCPGAVMFLFEGDFGNILHTGDCRLTPDCLQNLPEKYLSKKRRDPKCSLDYVFLDCTFGKSKIKIPSKHSAVQQVINCIWKHPDAPVVYLSCDLLGQEEILVEVSRTFGSKIYVDKRNNEGFHQALTILAPDILSDDSSVRFHVFGGFPKFYDRAKAKIMDAQVKSQKEPLFIRASTQWYACEEEKMDMIEWQKKQRYNEACKDPFGVWHVCYSMHSSYEELEWALQLLQPKRIVSTTPSCRAMELNYVKHQSSFGGKIASDDPLWKLLEIDSEVTQVSVPSQVPVSNSYTVSSKPTLAEESNKSSLKNIIETSSRTEVGLNLSPPGRRPPIPITLFGRARQGVHKSDFLMKEMKTTSLNLNSSHISSLKSESVEEDQEMKIQSLKDEKNEEEVVVENVSSSIRTSALKTYDRNLTKLYRSMNVAVPRPLPSLVELMNATKKGRKRRFDD